MKKKEFIGIDVSKEKIDVFILSKGQHSCVGNNEAAFKGMLKWFKELGIATKSIAICFEHTGYYSEALALFLASKKITFFMVSSINIKYSMGLQRGKSDKLDAKRIGEYISKHFDKLQPTVLQSDAVSELKKLLSLRNQLEKTKTAMQNRLKNSKKPGFIKSIEETLLNTVTQQIKQVDQEIKKLIQSDAKLNEIDCLLQSIKGLGPVSSWYLMAYTNAFDYFSNARKFACYCGIAPFEHQSGSSVKRKSKTDRRSNRKVNGILTMAANSAAMYNPELKEYFIRKTNEGKSYHTVINAIKNKLVTRAFAIVARKTPYVDLKKYAA